MTANPLLVAAQSMPTRLWNDSADPGELAQSIAWGAVGATCNPAIALAAIRKRPDVWGARLAGYARRNPAASEAALGWMAVEELCREGARLLEPTFEASGGRDGRMSIQTDPRLARDRDALVEQAVRFSGLAPNMIVKIPATRVGIGAIEEVTFRGVSVNATVSFTVAQAVAVAEAVERGIERRRAAELPEVELGSVVTIMGGRLEDWVRDVALARGELLPPGAHEWAGVAAHKAAYRIFRERGYRSRLLAAAFRNHLQWSELQGGDLVVSPPFEWQERIQAAQLPVASRIDEPVPAEALDALLDGVDDFARAIDPDGLTIDEFDDFGPTRRTLRQFLDADAQLDALVRDVLVPAAVA